MSLREFSDARRDKNLKKSTVGSWKLRVCGFHVHKIALPITVKSLRKQSERQNS